MHVCIEYICCSLCACPCADVYQGCMLSEWCVIVLSQECEESCWGTVGTMCVSVCECGGVKSVGGHGGEKGGVECCLHPLPKQYLFVSINKKR